MAASPAFAISVILKLKGLSMPSFKLDFHEAGKDEIPYDPYAYVGINMPTQGEIHQLVHLCPQCTMPVEFDHQIRLLQEELEKIRIEAQIRFEKSKYFIMNRSKKMSTSDKS